MDVLGTFSNAAWDVVPGAPPVFCGRRRRLPLGPGRPLPLGLHRWLSLGPGHMAVGMPTARARAAPRVTMKLLIKDTPRATMKLLIKDTANRGYQNTWLQALKQTDGQLSMTACGLAFAQREIEEL